MRRKKVTLREICAHLGISMREAKQQMYAARHSQELTEYLDYKERELRQQTEDLDAKKFNARFHSN